MHLFGVCLMDGVFAVADSSAVFEHGSAANGQSGGLGEDCGLHRVLHVAPQLLLQCCSVGPLPCSCFSEEATELWDLP